MMFLRALPFALLFAAFTGTALADSIPYANSGTIAPTVSTYATSSSGISLYYDGSTAGYIDTIGVYDVNTGYNSGLLFNNKTTSVGTKTTVGATAGEIHQGDQLVFYIDSPDGIFASNPAGSADGINHVYVTSYSGGTINGVKIPAGLFLGMEDQSKSHSDLNYNDEDVFVTGVSTSAVTPEPASLFLLGTGMLAMVGLLMRRSRAQGLAK